MNEQVVRIPNQAEGEDSAACARSAGLNQARKPRPAAPIRPARNDSRRRFLKITTAAMGAAGLWLMDRVAKRAAAIPENRETTVTVPWNAAEGVHFYDRMIVVNKSDAVAVFSSLCPHLGCRVNRSEVNELTCPCHGSRFSLQGDVVHGPATRSLRSLPFVLDRKNAVLRVTLEANQL
jgi:cytochrome b6-f complex iron-sulfur subunit